jgi:hypothetical protein
LSLRKAIKEHWGKGSALIASVFQAALAFQNFAVISLAIRFFICGLAGACATLAVADLLSRKKREQGAGFAPGGDDFPKPPWWHAVCVVSIVIVCILSVFLLMQVATFHSLRVIEKRSATNPFVGTIEIQPAHRPASLTLNLSTSQVQGVKMEVWPDSWNDSDRTKWGVRNQSEYGITLLLENFKSPQVFGVWYRLSVGASKIDIDVNSDPPEIQIIRGGELAKYQKNNWIFGGILCVGALLYWAYRSLWFRRTS